MPEGAVVWDAIGELFDDPTAGPFSDGVGEVSGVTAGESAAAVDMAAPLPGTVDGSGRVNSWLAACEGGVGAAADAPATVVVTVVNRVTVDTKSLLACVKIGRGMVLERVSHKLISSKI